MKPAPDSIRTLIPAEPQLPTCEICGKPVPDYVPEFCCSGIDCACMGRPMYPCTCSKECDAAVFGHIGKTMEERRIAAGIAKWTHPIVIPEPQLPTVAASAEQLRELRTKIEETIWVGEFALAKLREMCGGEATGFAGELLKRMNWGLGQFRECDAMLGKAWRDKNAAAREEKTL